MPLSCGCDWEQEPGSVCWHWPTDYSVLNTKRRRKCCHCGTSIAPGSTVAQFLRFKVPEYDIEIGIYGEDGEIPRAPAYTCEACSDLWFSFQELGYVCVSPWEDMRELAREHQALTVSQASRELPEGNVNTRDDIDRAFAGLAALCSVEAEEGDQPS